MTSTFTTVRDDIKQRLLTDTSTPQPSDAQIVLWVIRGFKWAMGVLPPVTRATATVDTILPKATVVGDRIYYVGFKSDVLLPSEWYEEGSTTIQFKPGSVELGGTVTYWRLNLAVGNGSAVLTDASTSVDTSCIFGTDWLEELVVAHVCMNISGRLSEVSPSGDGSGFTSQQLVYQKERDALYKEYATVWNQWDQDMRSRISARVSLGDVPLRESPASGLRNQSRVINRLTSIP